MIDYDEIVSLRESGLSQSEIAVKLGVSRQAVNARIKRGPPNRPKIDAKMKENALNFIKAFQAENGYSPSRREIEEKLNIGAGSVTSILKSLAADKKLTFVPGVARSIVLYC